MADGRLAKGELRRTALIEATLRVIERAGVAGVTHRAAAAEAELPVAAATYYFRSLDDLLLAALHSANESYAAAFEQLPADAGIGALGELAARLCRHHRARVVAEYELCLLAARRPALRPAITQWMAIIGKCLSRYSADPVAIRTAAAAFDGLLAQSLLADRPLRAAEFTAVLEHALR
jgi:DNA-binding transcriptional regulator YbjK